MMPELKLIAAVPIMGSRTGLMLGRKSPSPTLQRARSYSTIYRARLVEGSTTGPASAHPAINFFLFWKIQFGKHLVIISALFRCAGTHFTITCTDFRSLSSCTHFSLMSTTPLILELTHVPGKSWPVCCPPGHREGIEISYPSPHTSRL